MESVTIMPGMPKDIDRLLELENGAFQYDRLSRSAMRKHLDAHRHPPRVLVAHNIDGKVVGFILLKYAARSKRVVIYSYAVDPAARGKGVGEALLDAACVQVARTHPILTTHVRKDSPFAQARYEKSGFKKVGEEMSYYGDGCDAVIYDKQLRSPTEVDRVK